MRDTRWRIIQEALRLFAVKGYDGVSVRDIAGAVGVKESSLYKHFPGKQAIFEGIIGEFPKRYGEITEKLGIGQTDPAQLAQHYAAMPEEALLELGERLFRFFSEDEFSALLRKMLTMAQYSHPLAREVYRRLYLESPVEFQSRLFQEMMGLGVFVEADPGSMAAQFYGPIFLLLGWRDLHPEGGEQALASLRSHIRQFNAVYARAKV
ncbi:TetR/AcrR family transcriptional regulator [Paenibacillus sp. YN15]|uniref:TetR/AcrR family transcriptional regulator n=1 Tax=Paenibacillus sp. YN15 TaxID=1742774 RepID=UPI000DCB48A1|nr:TetR family transcriptional regulator [Paenibacillus sp. YN15]RAV00529.1 TetR/AcrR family transcriptional regulator [Paenibacillus sp. YN15]